MWRNNIGTPTDSSPRAPVLPSLTNLPIAIQKGAHSSRNSHPIYSFLAYHCLSSSYSVFISTLSSVSLPKSMQDALPSRLETSND